MPILYPQDRPLAAASLFAAARALEEAEQPDAAARVYRELVAEHPQTRPADEAQQRLESMTRQSSRRGADQ